MPDNKIEEDRAAPWVKPSPACKTLRPVEGPELAAFMASYFAIDRCCYGSIRIKPPANNILVSDGVTSVVLFREGQYQVELVIIQPGVHVPFHCHDDVDSCEVALSGQLAFFIEEQQSGFIREPRADGMSRDFGKFVPIPHDAAHGAHTGPMGACFLSVQYWRNGRTPTHVALNWRGLPMGAEHEVQLR